MSKTGSMEWQTEIRDMIWENYYNLATTAVQAMSIIWDDYANGTLAESLYETQGANEDDLLDILTDLTKFVQGMSREDRHKPAMQVYKEWNGKV